MALDSIRLVVIQTFISQVIASYGPYIQYAGTPYPAPAFITGYPAPSYAPTPTPVYTKSYAPPANGFQPAPVFQPAPSVQPVPNLQPYKTPAPPMAAPTSFTQATSSYTPSYAPTSATSTNAASSSISKSTAYQATAHQQPFKATAVAPPLAPAPPKLEVITPAPFNSQETSPKVSPLPKDLLTTVPPFDSNILNNLAIALQLLIVSNLIHNPPPETRSVVKNVDEDIIPAVAPLPIAFVPPSTPEPPVHSHYAMPNANFLGTSSFGDTGLSKSMMNAYGSPTLPAPRPMGLMSPYDAIGPNSPYSATFPSKVESKSPYHLSSDYNDLFSLTELFKI